MRENERASSWHTCCSSVVMTTHPQLKSRCSLVSCFLFVALGAAGCDRNQDVATSIGVGGGTVEGPNGVTLVVPAGALDHTVNITIELADASAASDDTNVIGSVYRFGPDGTTFSMPAEVRFPHEGVVGANVYWSHEGDVTAFSRVPSTTDGASIVARISHFSLGYLGAQRRSAFCSPVPTQCSTAVNGAAQSVCDFGEPGAMSPGYCFIRFDGAGNPSGGECAATGCAPDELCGNHLDDDCDGVPDDGCPAECTDDAACGAGSICDGGHCVSCATATNACSAANGLPDSLCPVTGEGMTQNGVCLHLLDAAGGACGTVCSDALAAPTDETCGNHIDDDNDGTVDDGCNAECVSDVGCAVGEICSGGFCQSCATAVTQCAAANGALDSACQVVVNETSTADAPCLRIVDGSGGACGSVCSSTIALPPEQCGNHIDDDNDGVVDNGCTQCTSDAICGAGQICPG